MQFSPLMPYNVKNINFFEARCHIGFPHDSVLFEELRKSLSGKIYSPYLLGDISLCSWARHLTLTVPLSTQVYI